MSFCTAPRGGGMKESVMDYCHYIQDGKGKYIFLPVCIGGAVNGPQACTCLMPSERIEVVEQRVEVLFMRVVAIEHWIKDNDPSNPAPFVMEVLAKMNDVKVARKHDMRLVSAEPLEGEV